MEVLLTGCNATIRGLLSANLQKIVKTDYGILASKSSQWIVCCIIKKRFFKNHKHFLSYFIARKLIF